MRGRLLASPQLMTWTSHTTCRSRLERYCIPSGEILYIRRPESVSTRTRETQGTPRERTVRSGRFGRHGDVRGVCVCVCGLVDSAHRLPPLLRPIRCPLAAQRPERLERLREGEAQRAALVSCLASGRGAQGAGVPVMQVLRACSTGRASSAPRTGLTAVTRQLLATWLSPVFSRFVSYE